MKTSEFEKMAVEKKDEANELLAENMGYEFKFKDEEKDGYWFKGNIIYELPNFLTSSEGLKLILDYIKKEYQKCNSDIDINIIFYDWINGDKELNYYLAVSILKSQGKLGD